MGRRRRSLRLPVRPPTRVRPAPGLGVWAQDGTDIAFLLEYDTGTEHLPQLASKLHGYAEAARTNLALTMPLLFCYPHRAASRPPASLAARSSLDLQIATTAIDPRVTCPACAAAWMPLHGGHPPMRLIDLGDVLPDPWSPNAMTTSRTSTS